MVQTILHNDKFSIKRGKSQDASFYSEVLHVRDKAYKHSPLYYKTFKSNHTDYDSYSDLYCLYINDEPMGTITVTKASDGKLDCEEYYPTILLSKYRNIISSASKFGILKQYVGDKIRVAPLLVKTIWQDQIRMGGRIDIVNVHEKMIVYYRRLGYLIIANSFFIHPQLHTPSYVMFLPADASHRSYIRHLFAELDDQLPLHSVSEYVEIWTEIPNKTKEKSQIWRN